MVSCEREGGKIEVDSGSGLVVCGLVVRRPSSSAINYGVKVEKADPNF